MEWGGLAFELLHAYPAERTDGRCQVVLDHTSSNLILKEACLDIPSMEVELSRMRQETHSDCAVSAACILDLPENLGSQSDYNLRIGANNGASTPLVLQGALSILSDGHLVGKTMRSADFLDQQEIPVSHDWFFQLLHRSIVRKNLAMGREVHYLIVRNGLESNAFLGCHLIRMYSVFDILLEAKQVFSKLYKPNVFAWCAIISAYAKAGQDDQAVKLYHRMQKSGVNPDGHVFVAALKACATVAAMVEGKQIHAHIIERGFEANIFVGSALIDMHAKCGNLQGAHHLFDRLPRQNVVIWNTLIAGYAHHGIGEEAFRLFHHMQHDGMEPDNFTFLSILKVCSRIAALEQGKEVHACIIEAGFDLSLPVANTLIDMYSKCGSLHDAHTLFDQLPKQNVITWSALIAGYAQHGHGQKALDLFQEMQREGLGPNQVTFVYILKACSCIAALEQGKKIHACISESGYESELSVGSAVIDMYAKCGSLPDALVAFHRLQKKNLVTWNTLIAGYAQHGLGQETLQLFKHMQWQGVELDEVTYACVLKACSSLLSLEQGKSIHACVIDSGSELDIIVSNTLIDLYAKCGCFHHAQMVFNRLPKRNVVTWSALIAGFVHHGHGQEAVQLFQQMQQEGMEPNQVTFGCILKACASMTALGYGKMIHSHIIKKGLESDVCVGSALIDMYAKCGNLQDAHRVFVRLPMRDVVIWSALIGGYAHQNDYNSAFKYFEAMQQAGFKPDNVAFLCLLSACSHGGAIDKGFLYFKSMRETHGLSPTLEHYNSLVDLLSHTGSLREAEDLLETIPFQCNVVGLKSLLSSCRANGNVNLGQRCFDRVVKMEPGHAAGYMLMSSIYSHAGNERGREQKRGEHV